MRNEKRRGGVLFFSIGFCFIAAALALIINNMILQKKAGEASDVIIDLLNAKLPPQEERIEAYPSLIPTVDDVPRYPDYMLNPHMPMPEIVVENEHYVTTITIPAIGIELPVAADWSYATLRQTPCRYTGSLYRNDMIICAHNYATHFGSIGKLLSGDRVIVTDMDGNVFNFEVTGTEILAPNDFKGLNGGEWDLTLFTCTVGGAKRVVVRCSLIAI